MRKLILLRMVVGANVTRLGDFLKFYATNLLSKVAQKDF